MLAYGAKHLYLRAFQAKKNYFFRKQSKHHAYVLMRTLYGKNWDDPPPKKKFKGTTFVIFILQRVVFRVKMTWSCSQQEKYWKLLSAAHRKLWHKNILTTCWNIQLTMLEYGAKHLLMIAFQAKKELFFQKITEQAPCVWGDCMEKTGIAFTEPAQILKRPQTWETEIEKIKPAWEVNC